jgi:geranylgeranyl reductase family protein
MAAATAAQAGLKVALLEKQPLPRHKTCGGGTPMVVQEFVRDLVPTAFVECDVRYMRHTWNFGDPYLGEVNPLGTDRPLSLWMMQRSVFDNALAQRAAQAGADLRDGLAVRSVELEGDRVRVRAQATTNQGELSKGDVFEATARHVIGADGANGVTAKAANLRQQRAIAIAMEVEYPHKWGSGHADLRPEVAHLEYGAVQRGYAWIFPKGDHLNVGAGLFRPKRGKDSRGDRDVVTELKKAIFTYLETMHLPYEPDQMQFHAHPLPIWNGKERLHSPNGQILLVGDAAGLINPFFGDGILHAVKSGVIAANSVAEGMAAQYSDRIHAEFAANFDAALRLAQFFYRYPGLCYRYGVKNASATRTATQLLCGDLPFNDVTGRVIRRLRRTMIGQFFGFGK